MAAATWGIRGADAMLPGDTEKVMGYDHSWRLLLFLAVLLCSFISIVYILKFVVSSLWGPRAKYKKKEKKRSKSKDPVVVVVIVLLLTQTRARWCGGAH